MKIAVVNESTVVTADEARLIAAACDLQMHHDIAPAWERLAAPVRLAVNLSDVRAGECIVAILDNADQAGALGYHDVTPTGQPYSRVFAKTVLDNGGTVLDGANSVAVTASHEIAEMFVDPTATLWADRTQRQQMAFEACDPCESDSYTVAVGSRSVAVSDFVLPAYFSPFSKGPYDRLDRISGPLTVRHGGYGIFRAAGAVTTKFGDGYPEWKKATKVGNSRTAMRLLDS